MNTNKHIIALAILFVSISSSNAQIDARILVRLDTLIGSKLNVYHIDNKTNMVTFKNIDTYFNANFNLNYTADQIAKGLTENRTLTLKSNLQIVDNKINSAIFSPGLTQIQVRYKVGKYERQFIKELRLPVERKLENDKVISISKDFVEKNKFLATNERDKVADIQIFTRKLDAYNDGLQKTGEKFILQRAVFKRKVNNLPVLNSKLIVDIHPQTSEILAFKVFEWGAIDPSSAVEVKYKTKNTILEEVNKALLLDNRANEITSIDLAYLQLEDFLAPVLKISFRAVQRDIQKSDSEQRTLLVILPENLEINSTPLKARLPEKNK